MIFFIPPVLLYFFSSYYVSQFLIGTLEDKFPPKKIKNFENFELAVVLGGMINNISKYPNRVELTDRADRIMEAVILYKKGNIRKILFSGGSGITFEQEISEASLAKNILIDLGVKNEDIIMEDKSKNTAENAIYSADILRKLNAKNILLITSAFHMKRSILVFKKNQINVVAYPTDFYSIKKTRNWQTFVPTAGNLEISTIAIKEWVGIVVYKMKGYID